MEQLIDSPVRIFSLVHELDDLLEPCLRSERLRKGTVEMFDLGLSNHFVSS